MCKTFKYEFISACVQNSEMVTGTNCEPVLGQSMHVKNRIFVVAFFAQMTFLAQIFAVFRIKSA